LAAAHLTARDLTEARGAVVRASIAVEHIMAAIFLLVRA
jgi:hypothetical protein